MFNDDGPWENDAIGDSTFDSADPQEVDDESDLCDCDPEYKDTVPIQQVRGGTIAGIGANFGEGTTVIVCRNCGGRFYENDDRNTLSGLGF